MQNDLHIAAIQANLHWQDIPSNLQSFEEKIATIKGADLIILPEMFSTGFTMDPASVAETMQDSTVEWMKAIASKKNAAIVGSVVIEEDGNYYNRAIFVHPDTSLETYDKRHSFGLAGEDEEYTSGQKKMIVNYKGWNIFPLICYDLRFPVWSRFNDDYDVLIYMANWPKPRILAWDSLLKARAIENMSYCIGVNRVGVDANNYEYTGHTAAFDFLGEEIAKTTEAQEDILRCTIQKSAQEEMRKKLNFLNDRDEFEIKL